MKSSRSVRPISPFVFFTFVCFEATWTHKNNITTTSLRTMWHCLPWETYMQQWRKQHTFLVLSQHLETLQTEKYTNVNMLYQTKEVSSALFVRMYVCLEVHMCCCYGSKYALIVYLLLCVNTCVFLYLSSHLKLYCKNVAELTRLHNLLCMYIHLPSL